MSYLSTSIYLPTCVFMSDLCTLALLSTAAGEARAAHLNLGIEGYLKSNTTV